MTLWMTALKPKTKSMDKCMTSYWYSDKFYININWKNGITEVKELLKECVKCKDLIECKKLDIFLTLLQQNGQSDNSAE